METFKYFKNEQDQPIVSRISHLHDKTKKNTRKGLL